MRNNSNIKSKVEQNDKEEQEVDAKTVSTQQVSQTKKKASETSETYNSVVKPKKVKKSLEHKATIDQESIEMEKQSDLPDLIDENATFLKNQEISAEFDKLIKNIDIPNLYGNNQAMDFNSQNFDIPPPTTKSQTKETPFHQSTMYGKLISANENQKGHAMWGFASDGNCKYLCLKSYFV